MAPVTISESLKETAPVFCAKVEELRLKAATAKEAIDSYVGLKAVVAQNELLQAKIAVLESEGQDPERLHLLLADVTRLNAENELLRERLAANESDRVAGIRANAVKAVARAKTGNEALNLMTFMYEDVDVSRLRVEVLGALLGGPLARLNFAYEKALEGLATASEAERGQIQARIDTVQKRILGMELSKKEKTLGD